MKARSTTWMVAGALAFAASGGILFDSGPTTASAQDSDEDGAAEDFTPAGDWSLQERQYWQKLQEELNGRTEALSKRCGTKISMTYAHESFRGRMTDGGSYGLDGYTRATCKAPIEVLHYMCTNSDLAKQAIQQKVRHIKCEWGETRYSISDGTIGYRFHTDERNASSYQSHFKNWLEQNL